MKIEYRVKAIERYIVTRYEEDNAGNSSVVERGTYTSPHIAYEVAYALCAQDHEQLGFGPGDERVKYPALPATQARSIKDICDDTLKRYPNIIAELDE